MSSRTNVLYVGGLESDVREDEIEDIFEQFGSIDQIDVKKGTKLHFQFSILAYLSNFIYSFYLLLTTP